MSRRPPIFNYTLFIQKSLEYLKSEKILRKKPGTQLSKFSTNVIVREMQWNIIILYIKFQNQRFYVFEE